MDGESFEGSAVLLPYESRRMKWLALLVMITLSAGLWWFASRPLGTLLPDYARAVAFVGLGVAVAWIPAKLALSLLIPEVELRLSPSILQMGRRARLQWRVRNPRARIASLRIWFEGREGARLVAESETDGPARYRQSVLDLSLGPVPGSGEVEFSLPEEARLPWPPAGPATWFVRTQVHARPLPKATAIYPVTTR